MKVTTRINLLFDKYVSRTITETEFDELLVWLYGLDEEQSAALSETQRKLWEKAKAGELSHLSDNVNWNQVLITIMESGKEIVHIKPVRRVWIRIAAAAVLILMLGGGTYLVINKSKKTVTAINNLAERKPENVLPNSNTTILTLADGSQIKLDSAANGDLADQGGTNVVKLNNGEIAYNNTGSKTTIKYNTITIPRGGRPYQLSLSDGSKVWLNASSSLRYPSAFVSNDRTVELTGEGYFEVAKNATMPFHVKYSDMNVEVLGTHFNVMAYEDENSVLTTLLEGAVRVMNSESSVVNLKPGQQSILSRSNGKLSVTPANIDLAVAWVNGYFQFDKADIKTILRQVGRWYDLDIEYAGKVPEDLFSGKIERNLPLTGIVKLLDQGKINVKVEGKKLIVQ